jgi:hypothetical protein
MSNEDFLHGVNISELGCERGKLRYERWIHIFKPELLIRAGGKPWGYM